VNHIKMLCLVLVVFPAQALGSTVLALPEGDLARRADAIVFGRVLTTRVLVSTTSAQMATEAELQVYDSIKGPAAGDVIRVQVPGGTANGIRQVVPGSPDLRAGQMFVGFLSRHDSIHYTPWGMGYGLLQVVPDPAAGLVVTRELGDVGLMGPNGALEDPLAAPPTPLRNYLARIRGHLQVVDPPALPGPGGTGVTQ
jgi:hypothetical protein